MRRRCLSTIDTLADRMGIEAAYEDAHHRSVATRPQTKKALLAAMGIPAANDDEARSALERLRRQDLVRPLPPVLVAREDRLPATVPVGMPAGVDTLRWTLHLEGGDVLTGESPFAALPLLAQGMVDGRRMEQRLLTVAAPLPVGYHRLAIEGAAETGMPLIVAPVRCFMPAPLVAGQRVWGIATQLYLVRSLRNWGIGDFTDLRNLVEAGVRLGASAIGVNPLHALFPERPERASPYAPSSRQFLNVLYIDVTAIPEYHAAAEVGALVAQSEFEAAIERVRGARQVMYTEVAALKLTVLRLLHQAFRASASSERQAAFASFREAHGQALAHFAIFHAIARHQPGRDEGWRAWPVALRDPDAPEVARFAAQHAEEVEFQAWMQWVADQQLAECHRAARAGGMAIGLYRDLAVGADPGGAEAWADQKVMKAAAHVGAPPDILNPAGQDWALPPLDPNALREQRYASFIALARANMRHAGGLRIDHVMALRHLYWIPEHAPPTEGAYVAYPIDDLMGIIALESQRSRCLVVGEDLGTVPIGFRERMAEAGILSYRVIAFEHDERDGHFLPPEQYPKLALATLGSHDLATLRGWWEERDIEAKLGAGLYPSPAEAERQRARRRRERMNLVAALNRAGLYPRTGPEMRPSTARAVHAFLARTSCLVAMVQLEDLVDQADQVNLPGTDTPANWRHRIALPLEELTRDAYAEGVLEQVRKERPAVG